MNLIKNFLFITLSVFAFYSFTNADNQIDDFCHSRDKIFEFHSKDTISFGKKTKDSFIKNVIKQGNSLLFIENISRSGSTLDAFNLWQYNCLTKKLSSIFTYNQAQEYVDYYEIDGYDGKYVFMRSRWKIPDDGSSVPLFDNNTAIQGNFILDTKTKHVVWTYNFLTELFTKPFILPKKYWYLSGSPLGIQTLEKSSYTPLDFKPSSVGKGRVLMNLIGSNNDSLKWFNYNLSTFQLTE